jgi:hypothetical protein
MYECVYAYIGHYFQADYIVTGDVTTPVKAVVTMDGMIKRTDGGNHEPPSWVMAAAAQAVAETAVGDQTTIVGEEEGFALININPSGSGSRRQKNIRWEQPLSELAPSAACAGNSDCGDRQYCVKGVCVGGGTTVFNAQAFLNFSGSPDPTKRYQYQHWHYPPATSNQLPATSYYTFLPPCMKLCVCMCA